MTEEEKNTKQAEEAEENQDEEEDDEEFEVVMPEANRVTMDPEEYKDEPDYLQVFANFYISEFNAKDLEIMNMFDDDHHNCVDINHFLQDNIHFPRKVLIKHALHTHDYNFQNLLDRIKEETGLDYKELKTYEAWENWYEDRRRQIPGSLS